MIVSRSSRPVPGVLLWSLLLAAISGCSPAPKLGERNASPVGIPSMAVVTQVAATSTTSETVEPNLSPLPSAIPSATSTIPPTLTLDWRLDLDQGHAEIRYEIPLTTQHVTPRAAILFFDLNLGVDGRVFYWRSDQAISSAAWVAVSGAEGRQQVKLDGLAPGVEYLAAVGILAGETLYRPPLFYDAVWGPVRFRTPSIAQETWRVGVLGDSGFGEQRTFDLVEQMAAEGLDFTLHMGDVVYKVEQNASPPQAFRNKFFEPFAPVLKQMPLYPVVGNHEWDEPTEWGGVPYYYWTFPGFDLDDAERGTGGFRHEYYAFSYGDVQFLMLNTQILLLDGRGSDQDEWLVERLADEAYQYSIPVFHVAPYTSGLHTFDGRAVRERWGPLFEAADVPLVLSGHDHNYERLEVNGITYIVSGGGSSVLYALRNRVSGSQEFVSATHYVVMELSPQEIHLMAVEIGGRVLDQARVPVPAH
jgi:predicted phosphodiesterase